MLGCVLRCTVLKLMKTKAVRKYAVKMHFTFSKYLDVLNTQTQNKVIVNSIRSVGHKIGTYINDKVALSCYDIERYNREWLRHI